uniref:AAA ATPase AAA+ lid domain-containing protein n=1 Tax=candidate division WOR-3 bacterium TaxID=2052148 RepID=A0A7V0Z5V3_UNCW3
MEEIARELEGYSGADIELIIEEAAFLAFETRRQNEEIEITVDHIKKAIAKTAKSVSEEEVHEIEQWAKSRNIIK